LPKNHRKTKNLLKRLLWRFFIAYGTYPLPSHLTWLYGLKKCQISRIAFAYNNRFSCFTRFFLKTWLLASGVSTFPIFGWFWDFLESSEAKKTHKGNARFPPIFGQVQPMCVFNI